MVDALLQRFRRHSSQFSEIRQVLPHRKPGIDSNMVQQYSHALLACERIVGSVVDENRSRVRPQRAADHSQRGGLAGAVGTQKTSDRSIGSLKRQVSDHQLTFEALSEALNPDHVSALVVWSRPSSLQNI